MKKTMMKRSLALGALMAFVITGSAMAADSYGVKVDTSDVKQTVTSDMLNGKDIGIYAKNYTANLTSNNLELSTNKYGFYVKEKGKLVLNDGSNIGITVNNENGIAKGIGVEKSNSSVFVGAKNITITSIGSITGIGLRVESGNNGNKSNKDRTASATLDATDGIISINTYGKNFGYGVHAYQDLSDAKLNAKNFDIEVSSDCGQSNSKVYGIYSEYGGNVVVKNGNVAADVVKVTAVADRDRHNKKGIGIAVYSEGTSKISRDTKVTVDANEIYLSGTANTADEGKLAGAIVASGESGRSVIEVGNKNTSIVELTANNEIGNAYAVLAQGIKANNGIEIPGKNSKFYSTEKGSTRGGQIFVNGKMINITSNGNIAYSVTALCGNEEASKIVIGNDGSVVNIKANGIEDAVGVASLEHASTTINGDSLLIEVSSSNGTASGIHAQNNGKGGELATVNVNSINTVIKAEDAITAYSEGVVNVNGNIYTEGKNAVVARGDAQVNINMEGKNNIVQMNGDIVFDVTNDGQSGLDADAKVNIKLINADSYLKGNVIKTQSGPSEDVDMTVNGMELEVANGGTWSADADSFVNNLKMGKGGIVELAGKNQKLSIDNLTADSAIVKTNDVNNQMVVSKDANAKNVTVEGSGAIADQIAADGATANKLAGVVVDKDDNTLANKVTTDEGVIGGRYEGTVDKDGKVTGFQAQNTSNVGISDMASIGLMAWRQENNDMNKRLGELRNSKGEHGVWTRMTRGESEFKSIKNQYNAYQIGYDEKLSTDKSWTVGAALTYTDAESSFAKGTGENTHKGFAIYGSKLNEDGSFIDLIAKYARLEHEFDTVTGIGSGEYDTNGYSVSAEYGKRFEKGNGFWVEPQVELTYGKVGSASYTTKDASAYQDGMESLVGRVGFALGKDIKQGNVYVRASYLYDFEGETKVTMTNGTASDVYEQDLGGGWFEVGVGTNYNLSDATYLYFDVEKTYGGDVATPWQWNAGVRYSF